MSGSTAVNRDILLTPVESAIPRDRAGAATSGNAAIVAQRPARHDGRTRPLPPPPKRNAFLALHTGPTRTAAGELGARNMTT